MGELANFFVSFGAVTKEFIKGKEEVEQGLKDVSAAAENQGRTMEQAGEQGAQALKETGNAAEEASEKANRLKETLEKTAQSLQKMSMQMKVAGGIITAALTATIVKTADYADKIDDMSKMMGVSADELTRWGYAAEQNGATLDQMAMALKKLYVTMEDASKGNKTYQEAFNKLGISITDTNGNLRSATEILPEIADAIAGMGSEIERAAVASEIFGLRVGPQLIPMLSLGGEGLRALGEEADRLGRTMSAETAQQVGNFNDAITALKASVSGLAVQFVQSLTPALQSLVERITNIIANFNKWGKENQALFDILSKIALLSGPLLIVAGTFLKMATNMVILQAEATKLGGIFAVLSGSVKKFFSFFTTPAGIAISAITAIGTAVYMTYSRWDGMIKKTQEAREALLSLEKGVSSIEEIKKTLGETKEVIQKNIKAIETWHKNMEILSVVTRGLTEVFNRLFKIEEKATGKLRAETELLQTDLENATKTFADELASGFEGGTEKEKELISQVIVYREKIKEARQEMDRLITTIERLKRQQKYLTPGTDEYKEVARAIEELETQYQKLFEEAGENAIEYNKLFKSLSDEAQEYIIKGKQEEVKITEKSLMERLELEKNFSKLVIDEQIKVLQNYKENTALLTEEEQTQIDEMLKDLQERFDKLNEAARERQRFTRALLDLGKITDTEYLKFLEQEVVAEENTAEYKKSIREELLNYTVSLYTKNIDALKDSNEKSIDLEKDTIEKRKQIYESYVQEVAKKEEEIAQIREKYSEKQQDLEQSMRMQLIEDLAGYGVSLSSLFKKPTEELARMWKSYSESGKSLRPLTEEAQAQLDAYAEAWEEAGRRVELASRVEEYLNLDIAMQEEINAVNERFAEFELKTAETLTNIDTAFNETAQEIQSSFITALENINTAMQTLSENFGIQLDSIEAKLKEFSGVKTAPIETVTEDLIEETLPSINVLREHAKLLNESANATDDISEQVKLNIKSQEELAREIYNQKDNLSKVVKEIKESGLAETVHEIVTYSSSGGIVGREFKTFTEPIKEIAPEAEKPFPNISAILPPETINESNIAMKGLGTTLKTDFIPISDDVSKGLASISQNIGDFRGSLNDAINAVTSLNRELAKLAGQNIKVAIDVQGTEKAGQQIVYDAISSSLRAGERI